jgi:5-methylcytosine-specific restriction endonuclease McrA
MNDIANKAIVLKLNKFWAPVHISPVSKALCDLMTGVVCALDIHYGINPDGSPNFDKQEYVNPVDWNEWIKLPVRPYDLSIHSIHMHIRVPTVIITKKYAKIPEKKFKGNPTKEGLAIRDNLIDPYTGKELEFESATIDHVIPKSRGGKDTYDNTVLTTKEINNRKGNKLNSEAGLTMLFTPYNPGPIKKARTIRKIRHYDWRSFIPNKKK